MTKKDFSTIQRMLGRIQGVALLDAVETIDAILDREILTEDEK